MRKIEKELVVEKVRELCIKANSTIDQDVYRMLQDCYNSESSVIAKDILGTLLENALIAEKGKIPLCQDTGLGIFFVELGDEVCIAKLSLAEILAETMSDTYQKESYRMSMVADPVLNRVNSGTNRPPIVHWEIVPGDKLTISFLPKGGGAENMSRLKMFNPLTGLDQIKTYIVDTVIAAGGRPCPPVIVGVGIGGSFDYAGYLAKKSLLKPLFEPHLDENWARFEKGVLAEINKTGIGPMGLGGDTTALAVKISTYPCHIASLPVAVNLQCHSHRHASVTI